MFKYCITVTACNNGLEYLIQHSVNLWNYVPSLQSLLFCPLQNIPIHKETKVRNYGNNLPYFKSRSRGQGTSWWVVFQH